MIVLAIPVHPIDREHLFYGYYATEDIIQRVSNVPIPQSELLFSLKTPPQIVWPE